MYACWRLLILVMVLAIASPAMAQEPKAWLGADVQDVTKGEADKLGWDTPHGARLGVVASGSPAEKAGLKSGDIIIAVDRTMIDVSAEVDAAIAAKRPGAEVRLQVLSGDRERRVSVTLGERPTVRAGATALPNLVLDTGGHMAIIKGLTFTPDGNQLVSGGDDKVIRVWNWRSGKTVRTIRGEVGPGEEGKIYALALSPDGRWLAAAGFMAPGFGVRDDAVGDIRLYDFAEGKLVDLLRAHGNVVNALEFSPDGKRLVSGGSDGTAILWDVESRKPVQHLKGHNNAIYAVAFTADSTRVVTGSDDTTLRLWRVGDGGLIAELKGHKKDIDRALAIRASDDLIASGDATGEIRLWDGKTGSFLRTLVTQTAQVGPLRFTRDGTRLISPCAQGGCSTAHQHVWDVATGKETARYGKHDNIVLAAAVSPDGQLVATGGGNNKEIHVWDVQTGETRHILGGTGTPAWSVGFSADERRIAWGTAEKYVNHSDRGQLSLQLQLPSKTQELGRPEPLNPDSIKAFGRARISHGSYGLVHRRGGPYGFEAFLDVMKDGKAQTAIERVSSSGYRHSAYTFAPDGQSIITGGNGFLSAFTLDGKFIGNFTGHQGDVWAVAPSANGRLLVSGSADQTVRLWKLDSRELIATLFRGRDGEWVMWTPQGYYMGSPGADKIVGWQINKGSDKAADYVGAEQLRQHLNRPDIVKKAIILGSAEQAVRESPGTTFQLADLLKRPVPRFRIVTPEPGSTQRGGRVLVKVAVEQVPDPIKTIRVQVNGRQVEEQSPEVGSGGFTDSEYVFSVALARGRNDIRITFTNDIGDKAESVSIIHDGEGDLDKRGTLYILAIGVDKYPGLGNTCGPGNKAPCDLNFSGADARAFVGAVEKRLKPSHQAVVTRVLVNGADAKDAPTAANILDALDLLKQARENDTVLMFIAGHGSNDGANYRFLATNAERLGDAFRSTTVVPWQILQEAVETTKGRRILLIDTCHSGNAYNVRLGNAAYHANIIAYTAARFDQEAMEDDRLGHGLFTYALIEGLQGKGGLDSKRQISTKELSEYVVKRVAELAKQLQGEQEPQYYKGRDAEDYVLVRW